MTATTLTEGYRSSVEAPAQSARFADRSRRHALPRGAVAEFRLDEPVEVATEDALGVADNSWSAAADQSKLADSTEDAIVSDAVGAIDVGALSRLVSALGGVPPVNLSPN